MELLIEESPAEKVFRDLCHKMFREQGRVLPLMLMSTRGRDKSARLQALRGMEKMGSLGSIVHCISFTKILICMRSIDEKIKTYIYSRREEPYFRFMETRRWVH